MITSRTAFAIAFYSGAGFPTENTYDIATTLSFAIDPPFLNRARFWAVHCYDHAVRSTGFMIFERCVPRGALNQGTQAARCSIVSWSLAKTACVAKDNAGAGRLVDSFYIRSKVEREKGYDSEKNLLETQITLKTKA